MRRITFFIIIAIASLASLIATVVAGYYVFAASSTQSNTLGNMWNGMMGSTQAQTANAATPYFGVAFLAIVPVAVVGIGGLIYFFAFPEIKTTKQLNAQPNQNNVAFTDANPEKVAASDVSPYVSVLKTLTVDE
jgi:hypothetical protein